MVKAYDIAVKKLIEVFSNKIPVFGLQNEDSDNESLMSQAASLNDDQVPFPMISVFRSPEITISDGSQSKRASSADGYTYGRPAMKDDPSAVNLVVMRTTLSYTVDVFDVTRASAEEIALKLFFRLRNNPEVRATFNFKDFNHSEEAIAELALDDKITNTRLNDNSKAQAYQIRFTFRLLNANVYDLIGRNIPSLDYEVNIKMREI